MHCSKLHSSADTCPHPCDCYEESCVNLEANHRGWLCLPRGYSGPQFTTSTAVLLYRTQATKPIQRDCAHFWRLSQLFSPVLDSLWPVNHVPLTETLCEGKTKADRLIGDGGTSPHARHQFWPGLCGRMAGDWAHLTLTGQARQLLVLLGTSSISWALSSSFSPHCQALSVQNTGLDTALIWPPHGVS